MSSDEEMPDDPTFFFDRLMAPLEEDVPAAPLVVEEPSLPAEVITEAELIAGHFVPEHDAQMSFFEKQTGGVADRGILEAILGEPYHVLPHQVFLLCGRHYFAVEEIIDPPQRWKQWLTDGRSFVPWPDLFAAEIFHFTAPSALLVHPDRYIAGAILSIYIERYGASSIEVVS